MKQIAQITQINISDLKNHPIHEMIYMIARSVEGLKESILIQGQLEAITIMPDGTIISGTGRVKALKELGCDTVKAIVKEYDSYEQQVMDLIGFNNTRKKLMVEVIQEVLHYKDMYGKRQGQRSDLPGKSAHKGSTRDMIAKVVGISSKSVDQILFIYNTEPGLLMAIDKGEATINSAYKEAKKIEAPKNTEAENISTDSIKENEKKSMDILLSDVCAKIQEDKLAQIIKIIGNSDAKQCQCPNCSSVLDFIELIKNHRYADNNN